MLTFNCVYSGAELYSMYVGEGEAFLREIFQRARLAAPSIVFFDEADAIAAKRCVSFSSLLFQFFRYTEARTDNCGNTFHLTAHCIIMGWITIRSCLSVLMGLAAYNMLLPFLVIDGADVGYDVELQIMYIDCYPTKFNKLITFLSAARWMLLD